ncbi:hypothetical protein [Peribacillus simplex]|uniref:hypothetical protein n=1 Tax=Peribacillus simplex TaxID=1478 RepID=UPI003D26CAAD
MNLKYGSNNPKIDTVHITVPINMYKSRIDQISLRIVRRTFSKLYRFLPVKLKQVKV